jgi:hypothetical protein
MEIDNSWILILIGAISLLAWVIFMDSSANKTIEKNKSIMRYSNFLKQVVDQQKELCLNLKFPEDDIRIDFHGMIYDINP